MRDSGGTAGQRDSGTAGSVGRIGSLLRRLAGMPDYQAHLAHLRLHHPESPIPTEGQFYNDFIRARYGDGPTRCC